MCVHRASIGSHRIKGRNNKLTERGNFFGATGEELLTSVKDDGSIPIGKVPTLAKRPANSTPFGIVGRPKIRVHEERKCRA